MPETEQAPNRSTSHDIAVQGTNNSSITSKRSVEALYYPKLHYNRCVEEVTTVPDGHKTNTREYFKYFVRKLRKRSPCINRGYWLRLHSIRSTLESIANSVDRDGDSDGDKRVLVINLGCGFDPLPFQLLDSKNADSLPYCNRFTFLDLDYPEVIQNKCRVIQMHPELQEILQIDTVPSIERIQTENYSAIPCDLNDSESYRKLLNDRTVSPFFFDPETPKVFIAEVSLAYMEPERADTIISICSTVPNSHMIILEQLIPAGRFEPFAKQMLAHFTKNGSPLQTVLKYGTREAQAERLRSLGFTNVNCGDLLQVWDSVDLATRRNVESVEPFDELEEFHLFAHHYVLVHGTTNRLFQFETHYSTRGSLKEIQDLDDEPVIDTVKFEKIDLEFARNFGASIVVNKTQTNWTLFYTSGCNPNRVNTTTIIEVESSNEDSASNHIVTCRDLPAKQIDTQPLALAPTPRACATFTLLNSNDAVDSRENPTATAMLIGGRGPPHRSFNDTWFFDCKQYQWSLGPPLPGKGRFRHCTVYVGGNNLLIFGGITKRLKPDCEPVPAFLLFNRENNTFMACECDGLIPNGLSGGACMAYNVQRNLGVLIGGEDENGKVSDRLALFTCDIFTGKITVLKTWEHSLFQRYGAKCCFIDDDDDEDLILIAGGTSPSGVFDDKTSFILVDPKKQTVARVQVPEEFYKNHSLFLVGFELQRVAKNVVYVIGGGATCYGFGAVSNCAFRLDFTDL